MRHYYYNYLVTRRARQDSLSDCNGSGDAMTRPDDDNDLNDKRRMQTVE